MSVALVSICVLAAVLSAQAMPVTQALGPTSLRYNRRLLERIRVAGSAGLKLPPPMYFSQQVDHTDPTMGTFEQQYFVNDTFYVPAAQWTRNNTLAAPVFLYIDGEGAGHSVVRGHIIELAAKTNALVVALEHRFYGESQPFNNSAKGPLSLEHLQLLTSTQALADLAGFTDYINAQYNLTQDNTWIVWGGSYAGAMSSWYRQKYPEHVYASVSSSGPVEAEVDFTGYNDVIARSYNNSVVGGSPQCLAAIRQGFADMDALLRNSTTGWPIINATFGLCSPLGSLLDARTMASSAADNFKGIVQYNTNVGFLPLHIVDVCSLMLNSTNGMSLLEKVAYVNTMMNGEGECLDASYADMIAQLNATAAPPSANMRQWTYQTCNEFGYFQSCEAGTLCPFSQLETVDFYLDICSSVFGIPAATVNANIDATLTRYGARNPESTQVVFINGGIDPWHALGVLPANVPVNSLDRTAIFIPDTSHCADLGATEPTDPADLTAARLQVDQIVNDWLAAAAIHNGPQPGHSGLTEDQKIIVGCSVAGGVIVLALLFCCCRRRRSGGQLDGHFNEITESA